MKTKLAATTSDSGSSSRVANERSALVAGRFDVTSVLGGGASSVVIAARDRETGSSRAVKLLQAEPGSGFEGADFVTEFGRLARLEHPNLVRVYDAGRLDQIIDVGDRRLEAGTPFIVFELLEGRPASVVCRQGTADERNAALLRVADGVASALELLHRRGLVHHDVKPDNVLVGDDGEPVLIDLGLATTTRSLEAARGTLAYMAPEALGGAGDHRVDLYGLGATLYEVACGRPPFAGSGPQLVRAILSDPAALRCDWIDAQISALIARLLRKDPARRPSSARAVLADIARIGGDHSRVAELSARRSTLAPAFVGREQQLAALERRLLASASAVAGAGRCVVVSGAPGVGKSRLVAEALRKVRQRQLAELAPTGSIVIDGVPGSWLRDAARDDTSVDAMALALADRAEREARQRPLILLLDNVERDPLGSRLVRALASSVEALPLTLVALTRGDATSLGLDEASEISVPPLTRAELAALARSMAGDIEPISADALERDSGGNPRLAVELVRRAASGGDSDDVPGLEDLMRWRRDTLSAAQRALVDGLVAWGEPIAASELARLLERPLDAELWADLDVLAGEAVIGLDGSRVALVSDAHLAAWCAAAGEALVALHARAATMVEDGPARARHLLAAGDDAGPARALAAAASLPSSATSLAIMLLEGALGSRELDVARRTRVALAERYVGIARYDEALALLGDASDVALVLLRSRAMQRSGRYADARSELEACLARDDVRGAARDDVLALLGQLRVRRGDARGALSLVGERVEGAGDEAAAAELFEVAGLAHYTLGDLPQARRCFDAGAARASGESAAARFAGLLGMLAFAEGRLARAAELYERALGAARAAGDVHSVATYRGNLGAVRFDLGRYGSALADLTGAARDLDRLGRTTEAASSLCNLGTLLALLGDGAGAGLCADRADHIAESARSAQQRGYVELVRAEIARRVNGPGAAAAHYRRAARLFEQTEASAQREMARAAAIDCWCQLGEHEQARAEITAMRRDGVHDASAVALASARVLVAELDAPPAERHGAQRDDAESLVEALAQRCNELGARGARTELWPSALALGRLLARRGQRRAARAVLSRAKDIWEEIVKEAPEVYRESLGEDPQARSLASEWQQLVGLDAEPAPSSPAVSVASAPASASMVGDSEARLRRLLAINKRLNSELDLSRLLELVVDSVIELTDAERGFLILVEDDGALSIKVARNIDRRSLDQGELSLSRSIAEQAARTGEPVVTVDAADDGRFSAALSVSDLRLRSVLAVPLAVKGRIVGTIYVDHRLRRGVFGSSEVALVSDFADQAAIAIDNARLHLENRRRQSEIETLNEQLASTVEDQAAELDGVREELRSSKQALEVRYDYGNIVGQTPRMQELFRLLDRVTDTQLPVVIYGESGTGKELVARAIHHNGPRKSKPFVGENCGAIPETLLESVLFGHARGAFTGAERERRGLFEVASGGTLFLDEVGEMSPGMQTKLLRVLQDGELRRVGGERVIKTDVRVVAASNRDLAQLVKDGGFREDLFYRLNVIRIEIPPLRERREDVPLLVDHFLRKHAPEGRRLTREALARLSGYRWPGNVRELENEVMRAAALGGELVDIEDLSPHIGGGAPLELSDPDDLSLKPRVTHLERELIQRALRRTDGNQSAAARLLGLSRYGLLKKLKRYFPERYS